MTSVNEVRNKVVVTNELYRGTKICLHCGKAYEAKRHDQKYCSNSHRVMANRRKEEKYNGE